MHCSCVLFTGVYSNCVSVHTSAAHVLPHDYETWQNL